MPVMFPHLQYLQFLGRRWLRLRVVCRAKQIKEVVYRRSWHEPFWLFLLEDASLRGRGCRGIWGLVMSTQEVEIGTADEGLLTVVPTRLSELFMPSVVPLARHRSAKG